jgi:hypothetical protein
MSNTDTTKPVLNPDLLTPRDLARARDALPGVDVSAMLSDPIDMITLTIFCLRRRDDPEFTWDQALDTPMSEFSQVEGPPQTPPPASNGSSPGNTDAKTSSGRRPSATSSTSPSTTTSG